MTSAAAASIALLRAALLTGPAAVESAADWLAAIDLDRLPAQHLPLISLALPALIQADAQHRWLGRLRGIERRAWYLKQLMLQTAERLMRACADNGVPVMLADAANLALTAYHDRPRLINRLTLIVPFEQAERACRILNAQGGQSVVPWPDWSAPDQNWLTHLRFRLADDRLVDLHWHAAPYWPTMETDQAAWQQARSVWLADRAELALGTTDQFVRGCWLAAQPGPAALIALADAAALAAEAQLNHDLDWPRVIQLAAYAHVERAVLATLDCLQVNLGLAAPPDVVAQLRARPLSAFEASADNLTMPGGETIGRRAAARLVYAEYRRIAAVRNLAPSWGSFLTFLQQRWGVGSRGQIPAQILARVWP